VKEEEKPKTQVKNRTWGTRATKARETQDPGKKSVTWGTQRKRKAEEEARRDACGMIPPPRRSVRGGQTAARGPTRQKAVRKKIGSLRSG